MCGLRHAQGEYVITMDDDLQNPPEELPKLLAAIQAKGLDLVYGSYQSKEHRRWRNLGSALVNGFYRLVFKSGVTVTSFRIIRRQVLDSIFSYSLNYTFIDGLLAWNTQRIGQTPVEHHPRRAGRSGYSLSKLAVLALNLFTNFSLVPLQWISVCGLLSAGLGLLTSAYYLIQYLLARIELPGYASLITAILVLGGLQLTALGIMAEYLGRLHLNVNRKPQYVERQVVGGQATGQKVPKAASRHAA
jgi:undecaprenyl-phosphate 4-deoxy-4-formamido-L-arabinose transferase